MVQPSFYTNNIINDGIACSDDNYVIYNENRHLILMSITHGQTKVLPFDGYFLNIQYPFVFFALKTDGFSLYRYDISSGECQRVVEGEVKWAQIVANKIYFTLDTQNYLHSYNITTGEKALLLPQDSNYLCVVEEKIYFSNWSQGKSLWVYDIPSLRANKLLDKDVAWINTIDENTLVFRSWHNRKTYLFHLGERSLITLNADGANYLHFRGGFIYYANKRLGGLWRQSVVDKRDKSCIFGNSVKRINTVGNLLLFQNEKKQLCRTCLSEIKPLPTLRYIEMVITTECNAQCKNCSNGIPHAVRKMISYDDFCEQLQLLLHRVSYIERFQVHGGEPFLNPDLHRIVTLLNGSQQLLNIRIATNGTIIPDEKTIVALRGTRIVLAISSYAFNHVKREKLIDICKNNNIRYILYGEQEWYSFDAAPSCRDCFDSCPINSFPCYYDSKIYLCSRICHLYSKNHPYCYIDMKNFTGDLAFAMGEARLKVPCRECTISSKRIQAGT